MIRALCLTFLSLPAVVHAGSDYVRIPAGSYRSALQYEDIKGDTAVPAYELMKTPVTNAEFLAFVQAQPEWRRDDIPAIYADRTHYLTQWTSPSDPGASNRPDQPVTGVSWFAANAYCEAQQARLPRWAEWEYVAAADATRRDARGDPAWRETILGWYAKPSTTPLADVGQTPANAYGVQDLHGLAWEWVEDIAALLVVDDKRDPGARGELKFCGGGSLNLRDPANFIVSMRLALLSSLQAADSTANLGFRCARDLPAPQPIGNAP